MTDTNVPTAAGGTPTPGQLLAAGVGSNDQDMVEKALAAGASPNEWNDQSALLIVAARNKNVNIAALLYAAGADISKAERYADERISETYRGITKENAEEKKWQAEYYQEPLDWLRKNSQEIGIRAMVIIGRDLTQKVSDIDTRLAALEKNLSPNSIEKTRLQIPTTP